MIKAVITLMDNSDRLSIILQQDHVTRHIDFNKRTEGVTSSQQSDKQLAYLLASMVCDKYHIKSDGQLVDVKYSLDVAEEEKKRLEQQGAKVVIV